MNRVFRSVLGFFKGNLIVLFKENYFEGERVLYGRGVMEGECKGGGVVR